LLYCVFGRFVIRGVKKKADFFSQFAAPKQV
jgi:hypothetical protein